MIDINNHLIFKEHIPFFQDDIQITPKKPTSWWTRLIGY